MTQKALARRQFIQFLAASPLFAGLNPGRLLADMVSDGSATSSTGLADTLLSRIAAPEDALDVFDFQRVAEHVLPPAHYGYLATGTDGDETLHANRKAFDKLYLRALRLVDAASIDTRLELLGQKLSSPIVIAPVGSQRAFHPEGELATARAARSRDHLQILSNVTTTSIEDVIAARGAPVWSQLYPTSNWSVGEKMVKRAEKAGAPVVVLTVDLNSGSNRVTMMRYISKDKRDCSTCHDQTREDAWLDRKPMYDGTDIFKALALGADAVCIGRAYIWGLAAFGQPGVEKVLDMLRAELAMVMGQMGTPTLKDIGPGSIGRH